MTTQIEPELPELPEPFDRLVGHYAEGAEVFTADQMRAYALSAIAAYRNKREGCDQCGSKRAVGNPLYCNACHAAFSTHPADAKASVSATGTIARSLPEW